MKIEKKAIIDDNLKQSFKPGRISVMRGYSRALEEVLSHPQDDATTSFFTGLWKPLSISLETGGFVAQGLPRDSQGVARGWLRGGQGWAKGC